MTTTSTTTTVDGRLAELRAEQEQIETAEVNDPMRAADDLPAWHRRREARQRRTVEIETTLRDLQQFRSVSLDHPDALRRYLAVARPIELRYERLTAERAAMHPGQAGADLNARGDIQRWYDALAEFARRLPSDSDDARRVLVREAEQWFRFRDAWLVAVATASDRGHVPSPEVGIGGELPPWLRWGAYRTDQANR